ncbi:hypothetical protein ACFO5R_18400 [Halosolutus amylolyticus]|uniref:DUF8048 domain-containing protein n=1 Tax=Halosolutus amylolyticus TaxID=2932267 RepID=A0ABD5PVB5_9EURY|nr:hypothetical protein [Halosolutus amylolyticus]
MAGEPIEGQVLLLTAAKASVAGSRLPDLVDLTQELLAGERDRYRREYERVYDGESFEAFLVDPGHWKTIGDELGFEGRELSAVRRAHEEQLLRVGRRCDRESEFETALEIREPVLVGTGDGGE